MTTLGRVLREHRSIILALAIAIVANIAVYALVVRPSRARAEGAADRAIAATNNLRSAEAELAAAKALVSGTTQAGQELSTFYGKVLPSDVSAARRMTYAALPALARQANVRYGTGRADVEPATRNQQLGLLHITLTLDGDYQNVRRFIYDLETSPAFIIIDDVTLTESDPNRPLALTMNLSAYYRLGANGS